MGGDAFAVGAAGESFGVVWHVEAGEGAGGGEVRMYWEEGAAKIWGGFEVGEYMVEEIGGVFETGVFVVFAG